MLFFPLAYKPTTFAPTFHQSISNLSFTSSSTISSEHSIQPGKVGEATMISAKRLVQMAKKWQRMAALARKRLTSSMPAKETEASCGTSSTSVASKGHCVVYSADGRRFEVPLVYLGTAVLGELLRMSQEEFGFASDDGRITLPCDATVMEYAMCLVGRDASEEVVRALLSSIVRPCHTTVSGMAPSMELKQKLAVSV